MSIILIGSLPAGAAAPESPERGIVPAGAFAVDLMRASGVPEAGWQSEADRLLSRIGVEYSAIPLTEGIAASMLRDLGLEVIASSPDRQVTDERAASFLRQADGVLSASGSPDRIGARMSAPAPVSLDDCLVIAKNHGGCVNCCKDLGLESKACSRFCVSFTGKKSTSEPLP